MKDRSGKGILRCAIYTRVSTDQGLEQDFNSLDAQREACEAYIKNGQTAQDMKRSVSPRYLLCRCLHRYRLGWKRPTVQPGTLVGTVLHTCARP